MEISSMSLLSLYCIIGYLLLTTFQENGIVRVNASHQLFRNLQSKPAETVQQLHRTGYHFQPEKNWINDPNGPMYYNGHYHLFYQYNPNGTMWGNIVWAHSVSTDLINWVKLAPAIYPSKRFDMQGCWSGSATILPGGHPVILYTGINSEGLQVQNYAIPANESDPYLMEWYKPDDNPVVYPTSVNESAFRDPSTAWFEGGHWKILIGSRRRHMGLVYLYRSKDFVYWVKAKHPFYNLPRADMLECPDFFPVSKTSKNGMDTSTFGDNVKHIMKISLDNGKFDYYTIGTYYPNKDKYVVDNPALNGWNALRFDYGKFYASKTFFDSKKNRRVLWGWSNESAPAYIDEKKGWAGIQAIPRITWLDNSGKQLLQWPIEEVNELRNGNVEIVNAILKQGERIEITGITAVQADVEVVFSFSNLDVAEGLEPANWGTAAQDICTQKGAAHPGGIGPFGVLTLASQNLEEYTAIFFRIFKTSNDTFKVVFCADTRSSSLGEEFDKRAYAGFVDIDLSTTKLSLRTLIDHSVVESFADGGKTCILTRVYPTLAVDKNAHLFAFNNGTETVSIETLNAWSMKSPKMNVKLQDE